MHGVAARGVARVSLVRRKDVVIREIARSFSSNLLGYNPMAAPVPSSNSGNVNSAIPTAKDVTTAGGIWAPTSAKRDKLTELKLALEEGQETLDDAASAEEKLDLYLADGIMNVVKMTDYVAVEASSHPKLQEITDWLQEKMSGLETTQLHQVQWEDLWRSVFRKVEHVLTSLPAEQTLKDVRDYFDANQIQETEVVDALLASHANLSSDVDTVFSESVVRFRLLLAMATAEQLQNSWNELTQISDQDRDRAAVQGIPIHSHVSTLSAKLANDVLVAFLTGSCTDRVDAVWSLFDKDADGLLEKDEMNQACQWAIAPIAKALDTLMDEALNARLVTDPLESDQSTSTATLGWRQRRKEVRKKKRLALMFKKTLKTHFEDEVEMPHRLRCIYAWANKQDQDNKVDSVLVDEEGWNGRKRYVELHPKISLPEFREVQQEHFTHLDRIGTEYLKSFREDLLVAQGKGRQNRELIRDCTLFLAVVCAIDYAIVIL